MKIDIFKAVEITQMIVPEIKIECKRVGDDFHITAVRVNEWNYYIEAMHNASDMLLEELWKLPDVSPITEIEPIATDLNCLISCFHTFYVGMMKELEEICQEYTENLPPEPEKDPDSELKRFSRYRRNNYKTGTDE